MNASGLHGTILNENKPVVGAMIRVTGNALQGYQSAATDSGGKWCIPSLPLGINFLVEAYAPSLGYARTLADVVQGQDREIVFEVWNPDFIDFPQLPERPEPERHYLFCPACGNRIPSVPEDE